MTANAAFRAADYLIKAVKSGDVRI